MPAPSRAPSISALVAVSLYILHALGALSPTTAIAALAIGSLLVSSGCLYRFRKAKREPYFPSDGTPSQVIADHWRYGRWAAATALAAWIPSNIFYLILPMRFGLESSAALRAMMIFMTPLLQSVLALAVLLIPMLVRKHMTEGPERMKRALTQVLALFIPIGALYALFLAGFGERILRLLYAGRYSYVPPLALVSVAALPITGGIAALLGAALRALDLPHLVFWSYLGSAIVALTAGTAITLHYGVTGAAFALVLDDLPLITLLAVCLIRYKGLPETIGANPSDRGSCVA